VLAGFGFSTDSKSLFVQIVDDGAVIGEGAIPVDDGAYNSTVTTVPANSSDSNKYSILIHVATTVLYASIKIAPRDYTSSSVPLPAWIEDTNNSKRYPAPRNPGDVAVNVVKVAVPSINVDDHVTSIANAPQDYYLLGFASGTLALADGRFKKVTPLSISDSSPIATIATLPNSIRLRETRVVYANSEGRITVVTCDLESLTINDKSFRCAWDVGYPIKTITVLPRFAGVVLLRNNGADSNSGLVQFMSSKKIDESVVGGVWFFSDGGTPSQPSEFDNDDEVAPHSSSNSEEIVKGGVITVDTNLGGESGFFSTVSTAHDNDNNNKTTGNVSLASSTMLALTTATKNHTHVILYDYTEQTTTLRLRSVGVTTSFVNFDTKSNALLHLYAKNNIATCNMHGTLTLSPTKSQPLCSPIALTSNDAVYYPVASPSVTTTASSSASLGVETSLDYRRVECPGEYKREVHSDAMFVWQRSVLLSCL